MSAGRSLAAAQTIPIRGDVDANVEQHVRLARTAAEEGAQVLVFPELSLTGYELDLARALSFSKIDPRLAALVDAASASGVTLIVGAPVSLGSYLFIGAFIIFPDRTVDLYTKHHLGACTSDDGLVGVVPPGEASVFRSGSHDPLVHFGHNTGAVAVCADVNRPTHPARAAARGARTYFASMFVVPSDVERERATLRGHAERHSMAVVFANYGGPSGGLSSGGRSSIWSANGELLADLPPTGTGIVAAAEDAAGWRAKATVVGDSTAR